MADQPIVRPDIRGMQRDEVGFREQDVEGTIGYAERQLARRWQPGAVGVDDRHAEDAWALDDQSTSLREPYDPERVAIQPGGARQPRPVVSLTGLAGLGS